MPPDKEAKARAREILDRPEHRRPAPGKEPIMDAIPAKERRGKYRGVKGGGPAR